MTNPPPTILAARKAGRRFLLTEIFAGGTFAAIAETRNGLEAARNRAHARAAHDVVARFVGRTTLTQEEREEILASLGKLKQRLQALGERF